MILKEKAAFAFHGRNKRPSLDRVNAMLNFAYSLMTGMCSAALESVGLDPYVGVLHTDRPGRPSLSLDLVEEFRALCCDRFVLTLINRGMIHAEDFDVQEDGAVSRTDGVHSCGHGKSARMI
jgi:CRISPR-associated protein Cas1